LKREEATNIIKEIELACDGFGQQGVMLMPPNADDVLSHGYQLHIKPSISEQRLACIKPIVEKHQLAMINEPKNQVLVIYRPIK
jgi:hypothetical protein